MLVLYFVIIHYIHLHRYKPFEVCNLTLTLQSFYSLLLREFNLLSWLCLLSLAKKISLVEFLKNNISD